MVLGRVADAGAHLDARRRGVVPEDGQLAGVARAEPEHERHERRLARAVRPEQARDPGPDVRGQTGERDGLAEALGDVARGDDGSGEGSTGSSGRSGHGGSGVIVAATPATCRTSGRPACRGPCAGGSLSKSEGVQASSRTRACEIASVISLRNAVREEGPPAAGPSRFRPLVTGNGEDGPAGVLPIRDAQSCVREP